jgi:predicted dehydrogenase
VAVDRVLVIGLGSMGKRRVRNLKRLGVPVIIGFDPRPDRRAEALAQTPELRTVDEIELGFAADPQAVVVSTPPDLHVQYARQAVGHGLPFFTEASVVDDQVDVLLAESRRAGVVAAPSCTLRFHPSIRTMKRLVDDGRIGKLLAYTHHSGQYLPDWHPWEDYRRFYAGQRITGACREIVPFELIWLTWIAGPVDAVTAFKGKTSDLDVDIDDVYQVLGRHAQGALGHLLVDVLAREPIRRCTLVGSEGTIHWEWATRTVALYEATSKRTEVFEEAAGTVQPGYVHAEEPYVDEMRTYLAAVAGDRPWPYTLEEDIAMLRLLQAAERSSDEGRHIAIDPGSGHTRPG